MICYAFHFDDHPALSFEVDPDADSTPALAVGEPIPDWLRLDSQRCACCELPPRSRRACPAALSIRGIVEAFDERISYEEVRVTVESKRGRLETYLPLSNAVQSLVGLRLALSACPVMTKLRPMARYHLPFGSQEHTIFRFAGTYLIAQYLRGQRSLEPDWTLKGLLKLFKDLHQINGHLADRIRSASAEDATVNSVIFLDSFATAVQMDVEESLTPLLPLFAGYLTESS